MRGGFDTHCNSRPAAGRGVDKMQALTGMQMQALTRGVLWTLIGAARCAT